MILKTKHQIKITPSSDQCPADQFAQVVKANALTKGEKQGGFKHTPASVSKSWGLSTVSFRCLLCRVDVKVQPLIKCAKPLRSPNSLAFLKPKAFSCSFQLLQPALGVPKGASLSHNKRGDRWDFFPQCGQSLKLKGAVSAEAAVFEVDFLKIAFFFYFKNIWEYFAVILYRNSTKKLEMRAHLWMWFAIGICSLLSLASSQTWISPQLFHSSPYIFSLRFYLVIWR